MIDALIAGKLYGAPVKRTSTNDNSFVTAKVRVAMRDGEGAFVNIITFSRSCGEALLALQDGDSVALSGELKVSVYEAKDATWKPSLDLMAHVALSPYHVARTRKAVRGEVQTPEATNGQQAPAAGPTEEGFDDAIPF